jgi:DNA-binding SARP family transcriptional activator
VRGEPCDGAYFWWLEQTTIDAMRAQVTDTAALLAQLELDAGDPAASARAARAGLAADPASEPLWRAVMTAEAAAGNTVGVHRAWRHLSAAIADFTPGGMPHPDTVALYRDLVRERVAQRRVT